MKVIKKTRTPTMGFYTGSGYLRRINVMCKQAYVICRYDHQMDSFVKLQSYIDVHYSNGEIEHKYIKDGYKSNVLLFTIRINNRTQINKLINFCCYDNYSSYEFIVCTTYKDFKTYCNDKKYPVSGELDI